MYNEYLLQNCCGALTRCVKRVHLRRSTWKGTGQVRNIHSFTILLFKRVKCCIIFWSHITVRIFLYIKGKNQSWLWLVNFGWFSKKQNTMYWPGLTGLGTEALIKYIGSLHQQIWTTDTHPMESDCWKPFIQSKLASKCVSWIPVL